MPLRHGAPTCKLQKQQQHNIESSKAAKQQSSKAAKQQSSKAAKQQSSRLGCANGDGGDDGRDRPMWKKWVVQVLERRQLLWHACDLYTTWAKAPVFVGATLVARPSMDSIRYPAQVLPVTPHHKELLHRS
ncbi:hypothetical protein XAP3CFBP6996_021685 [Xanthomonas citri pv. fuscans CFBP 6996]|nr:hypothetical protein XAP3CFBP6996_021685 [Xanthomonas citri pv. fuscans CFBP 6996]QWN18246.1 hypothetical protein DGN02_22655 [Xanthomonas citri]